MHINLKAKNNGQVTELHKRSNTSTFRICIPRGKARICSALQDQRCAKSINQELSSSEGSLGNSNIRRNGPVKREYCNVNRKAHLMLPVSNTVRVV